MINELKELAKANRKRIILTETNDNRILEAASIAIEEGLADIILIGQKESVIPRYNLLEQATWIDPDESELLDGYMERLYELRQEKGMTREIARKLLLNDYMYFACMLVLDNQADGVVSGVCHTSSDTIRPALQIIKGEDLISSFFIMERDNTKYIFADCGLNQNPTSGELAQIATSSLKSYEQLIGDNPKLAFLSFSTHGSSIHEDVDKVRLAVDIAKATNPDYLIDGELQLDAAISPEVAGIKCPMSPLKGEANILIFPNLDSGNIGYKLAERLGGFKAYGPLLQGLNKPVNDLSRGSSVEDIVGVIVITALQAAKNMV